MSLHLMINNMRVVGEAYLLTVRHEEYVLLVYVEKVNTQYYFLLCLNQLPWDRYNARWAQLGRLPCRVTFTLGNRWSEYLE